MKEKEVHKNEIKEAIKPIYFENIQMDMDYNKFGTTTTMPILFIDPDGKEDGNAMFAAPNAYQHVLDLNRSLYESRCRINAMANGLFDVRKDKKGVDIESAEFYNKTLSTNVINKMLDQIEYNCNIICAGGMYNITRDFYIGRQDNLVSRNNIRNILLFPTIRSRFDSKFLIHRRDFFGGYILFESDDADSIPYDYRRPEYCKDNNILNTMLNLKMEIISALAYNYGGWINYVLNSGDYDIGAMCKAYNDTGVDVNFNAGTAYSFVTGCLNEQAQRDIAKMGDIIEISIIDSLHYFMNNVIYIEYPESGSIKDFPGVKNYHKLPDGTEYCEF